MKRTPILTSLFVVFSLLSGCATSQETLWQSSYRLEAAGNYSEAISVMDQVLANDPDAELKIIRRGWLYYSQGKYNESIREYRLAMDRNGKSIDARLGVTLPLLAQKRWREAEQAARVVLDMAPNNYTALLRLAIAQEGLRDWDGMLKTTITLTAAYPTDASGFVYLARAYAGLNRRGAAIAAYTSVLSRYPGHLEALAYLEKK